MLALKRSLFLQEVNSNKCSERFGFNNFYAWSPCTRLTENYTELFYMIDEGDIPSVQCKMSLRGPKSIRKVDGLSLIFIDVYVPAFTPRFKSTESSLQLSENITLFAVCRIRTGGISRET
jgi:hypothetical protein